MIKFDFETYMSDKVKIDLEKKNKLIERLKTEDMAGFINNIISNDEMNLIKEHAKIVRNNADVLLIIGIGGSYMGSYSIYEMFKNHFIKEKPEIIYIGNDLSSKYLSEVLDYIKDKSIFVNVISKSGTTLEIRLIYQIIKNFMKDKYDDLELKKRIIVTTDEEKGVLRDEVNKYGYKSFVIPTDIGGRYSLMTSAHLFPLAVAGFDIDALLNGYINGLKLIDEAYLYASIRIDQFNKGKYIENFSVYNSNMYYYTEWIKQLFGESEGKNNKGIFPISTVNTRDLHSLGQFIQQGNNIIFETIIKVLNNNDIKINNISLNKINNLVCDSVCVAHLRGNTPSNVITIDSITLENIGEMSAFFMLAAVFSSYLFSVDPFTQPGVEEYKDEVKKKLDNDN